MAGRKIYVEIGDSTVPVAIDENTRARDIKRQLGAEDYNLRVKMSCCQTMREYFLS